MKNIERFYLLHDELFEHKNRLNFKISSITVKYVSESPSELEKILSSAKHNPFSASALKKAHTTGDGRY